MIPISLREYQEGGIEALRDGFRQGLKSQILYAPTGAGKTEIAMALMAAANERGTRSAMVLDRIVLCEQTSARLDKHEISHGVLQSGHWRYRPEEQIQVCSAQTLEKRGSFPDLRLLIIDECHTQRKATSQFIANHPDVRVVGLSASPFAKGLGATYQRVVNCATTADLIDRGNLVPLRVFACKEIDMTGAKKVAGEWSDAEASTRGMKITGDVVSEWRSKSFELFGKAEKTIVFCAGVAHGVDLVQKFAEAGFNFVSISYKDDDDFKRDVIAEFARPNSSIIGLIATDILTKGFDCPDVKIGVSARPFSKSLSSHIQQMGRVMRPYPGKHYAAWLCHSGNYLRHQEAWEQVFADGVAELDDGREKAAKERTEREKKIATCPKCSAVFPMKNDVCAHCGYQRLRRNGVSVLPGELEELDRLTRVNMDEKRRWLSQLTSLARERGYKPGWAAVKYKEKFGVWPKSNDAVPMEPSPEVVRWVRSRQIAYAKSQRRAA